MNADKREFMTSSRKATLFRLLDTYAREHYQCFLAELFLDRTGTRFILCFRPADSNRRSHDRYACRYLNLAIMDAETTVQQDLLGTAAKALLDKELAAFNCDAPKV